MKLFKIITIPAFFLLTTMMLMSFSCDAEEPTNTEYSEEFYNDAKGLLLIRITDSPFPIGEIAEANVTIDSIRVRIVDEEAGNPYLTVYRGEAIFNLVSLRNGVTEDLPQIEIPVGSYDQVRIYVSSPEIILSDARRFDLKVPSGSESGIKVFINPYLEVAGGLTSELIIDFDLSRSFVVQGNPNTPAGIKGFIFKPVVRATNNSTAGRILGVVQEPDEANSTPLPVEEAQIVLGEGEEAPVAFTNEEGYYEILGVPAGMYTMEVSKEGYTTVTVDSVFVVAGNQTIRNFDLIKEESGK